MVKVESISKFGFVADGKKYRYDEVTVDRADIVPGAEIELNGEEKVAEPKKFTPTYKKVEETKSSGMTKDEWQAKDRRISRQGCIQVAVQVMGDWDKATELADKMLEYVNS